MSLDISIIIPLYNEEESLKELTEWIQRSLSDTGKTYEILFVDDGSTDTSSDIIRELSQKHEEVRGVVFRTNQGKSQALNIGFDRVEGDYIITMDADLQDSPDEIIPLYEKITKEDLDIVSGWKKERHDPWVKVVTSRFFNRITRSFSQINIHDFNCGLKIYRKEVVKNIYLYNEMHRYIPVIAKSLGFKRIAEKVVVHQERRYGETKFGIERFFYGALDLLSLWFVSRFAKRPMHLFGTLGIVMFGIGLLVALYIGAAKFYRLYTGESTILVAENGWFHLGLVSMVIGTQFFLTGFIGEHINSDRRQGRQKKILIKEEFK